MSLDTLNAIDSFIWGPPLLILLIGTGIMLTVRLRLLQVFRLPRALKLIFTAKNQGEGDIDSFKALCTALAATVGTGNIVGVKAVNHDNEIMLITTEGIIIRIKVADTALLGRITSGVKLINLDENVTVASIAKVRENKELETADTSELLTDEEEAASAALAAENAKKAAGQADNSETDDELMEELLKRAEADAKDDSDEE